MTVPIDQGRYDQLRTLASTLLRCERRGHIFQPEDLVHEVILRCLASANAARFSNWEHLQRWARTAMCQRLIDSARATGTLKRGNGGISVGLEEHSASYNAHTVGSAFVSQALLRLSNKHCRKGAVAKLRVECSLSFVQIARELKISHRTVRRDWQEARAFFIEELQIGSARRLRRSRSDRVSGVVK